MSPTTPCNYCDSLPRVSGQSPGRVPMLDAILESYPIHTNTHSSSAWPPTATTSERTGILHHNHHARLPSRGPSTSFRRHIQRSASLSPRTVGRYRTQTEEGGPPPLAPTPQHHPNLGKSPSPINMDRSPQRGGGDSTSGSPSSMRSYHMKGVSASPSLRPHGLTALSPLQAFSPLQKHKDLKDEPQSAGASDGGRTPASESTRSRAGSVTKSLSRRASLYHSAEVLGRDEMQNEQSPSALFSRLTLVKAPGQKEGIRQ